MELIADGLLIAGAAGAAIYCRALARRLGALKDLDSGLGAAIAALSRQVDEMRHSLDAAKSVSDGRSKEIMQMTARAEMAAGRLELLLASLHEGGREKPLDARRRRGPSPAERLAAAEAEDRAEQERFEAERYGAERTGAERAGAERAGRVDPAAFMEARTERAAREDRPSREERVAQPPAEAWRDAL